MNLVAALVVALSLIGLAAWPVASSIQAGYQIEQRQLAEQEARPATTEPPALTDIPPVDNPIGSASPWKISIPKVNPMDGVRDQFVSTGLLISLVLCFENGKACRVPVYVDAANSVHCWIDGDDIGSYHRRIRIKFDDGKARSETWGITDDHKGLIPPDSETFIAEMKRHKTLMVEFGCARYDRGSVITFDIQRLQETLNSADL